MLGATDHPTLTNVAGMLVDQIAEIKETEVTPSGPPDLQISTGATRPPLVLFVGPERIGEVALSSSYNVRGPGPHHTPGPI